MKEYEFSSIESFLRTISRGVSVVCCCTSWSSACRGQYQAMIPVAGFYEGQATVFHVDMVRFPELGEYLAIQSVPTTLVFEEGVEVNRLIGRQPRGKIHAVIDAVVLAGHVVRDEGESLSA